MPDTADETVQLTDQERVSLVEALGLPYEREWRIRRLLGDIAIRRGCRPSELSLSWDGPGPTVHHRMRR
jgi:hypothetical protein